MPPRIIITGEAAANGIAKIVVADNGIGFEQEYAESIFKTFTRVCIVPESSGVDFIAFDHDLLWDRYFTAALQQLRQYGPLSSVVRKAYKAYNHYSINPKTVAKWRKRTTTQDAPMRLNLHQWCSARKKKLLRWLSDSIHNCLLMTVSMPFRLPFPNSPALRSIDYSNVTVSAACR